jgi:hypothetical protein
MIRLSVTGGIRAQDTVGAIVTVIAFESFRNPFETRGLHDPVRIVADEPVHSQLEHAPDIRGLVHGPGNQPQPESARCRGPRRVERAEIRRPGARAGGGNLARVRIFPLRKVGGRELGRFAFDDLDRAPVEALQRASGFHAGGSQHCHDRRGEGLWRQSFVGRTGQQFQLDVEPYARGAMALQELGQCGDPGAIDRLLPREAPRVLRARPDAADVVALQLVEVELADERRGRGDPTAVRAARHVGIEPPVVVDHDYAVAAHADVELEGAHAELERAREAGQRVLRGVAARAAVALEVEAGLFYRRHFSGEEEASQIPAPTATTPKRRCTPSGSPMSTAARSDAATGLTVMVLATRVGVVRSSA